MSPQSSGLLAYWHSGGSIESRSGALSDRRAVQLLAFYTSETLAGFQAQDAWVTSYCARMSREVAAAIIAADAWRRIA
jgi:hypothetical protein